MVCFFPAGFDFLTAEIISCERQESGRGEKERREEGGMCPDIGGCNQSESLIS